MASTVSCLNYHFFFLNKLSFGLPCVRVFPGQLCCIPGGFHITPVTVAMDCNISISNSYFWYRVWKKDHHVHQINQNQPGWAQFTHKYVRDRGATEAPARRIIMKSTSWRRHSRRERDTNRAWSITALYMARRDVSNARSSENTLQTR